MAFLPLIITVLDTVNGFGSVRVSLAALKLRFAPSKQPRTDLSEDELSTLRHIVQTEFWSFDAPAATAALQQYGLPTDPVELRRKVGGVGPFASDGQGFTDFQYGSDARFNSVGSSGSEEGRSGPSSRDNNKD